MNTTEFEARGGEPWELFLDRSYLDMWCVRPTVERDFNSGMSFHFFNREQAEQFMELLIASR